MALYLPIRAISRSQQVRIGGTEITRDATHYVDISDGKTRRDLERHQAFGAVIVVGSLTASNSDGVVVTGGAVTAQGSPDQTVAVAAGELWNRGDGKYVSIVADAALAASAAHGSLARVDIVQVDLDTGVASYKSGTAAASPVAPAPDSNKVAIANVARAATDNTIASGDITDVRPRG